MIVKLFLLVSCAALTIAAQELVQPNLDGFKYPALARAARIEGTVEFVVKPDGAHLVSGHQLLVPAARSNLEKWAVPYGWDTPLLVTYVFRQTGEIRIETIEVDRPIGDTPPVYKHGTKDGLPSIEIEIGAGGACVQPDVVALAALRH